MAQVYNVIFRGDIAPGFGLADVRERLRELFNLDDQRLGQLFSGRPLVIKKNLDREKAEQFCGMLAKWGALAEIKAVDSLSPAPTATSAAQTEADTPPGDGEDGADGDITLAPVGADVLKDHERSRETPVQVSTDHLSLDTPGADVLRPEERKKVEERDIDLSHLHVEPPDSE